MLKVSTLWSATLAPLILATACGGASESNASWTEGGAATSSAGATAHAGAADGENAGAPSQVGGSATDSAAGTPNSANGGDSNAGGAEGKPPAVDPTVREGCAGWCEGVASAGCDPTTQAECLLGCRALANSPTCNSRYKALFACGEGKTFTCGQDGDAVPEGCEVPYAQAALCVLGNPDETLAQPCQAYCDSAAAAACPNSPPAGECAYGCQVASSLVPTCAEDWKTFVECAANAEVTCNDSGDPSPSSCAAGYLRYVACIVDAGQ
jgi:hypothetical protein